MYNDRRKPLPVTDYRIGRLAGKILDKVNAPENIGKFTEELRYPVSDNFLHLGHDSLLRLDKMSSHDGLHLLLIRRISGCSRPGRRKQLVCNAAQRRYDYNDIVRTGFDDFLGLQKTFSRADRRTAELQNSHGITGIN